MLFEWQNNEQKFCRGFIVASLSPRDENEGNSFAMVRIKKRDVSLKNSPFPTFRHWFMDYANVSLREMSIFFDVSLVAINNVHNVLNLCQNQGWR